jgi:hypothetical protein
MSGPDPSAAPATASGGCLCGAVRFTGRLPTRWVAHCHCSRCRRAHGAPFVTWAGFERSAVHIDDGDGQLRWHPGIEGGRRAFCGRCGSPMFFASDRWPGELHVARALFDDPLDRSPQAHVFVETQVDWVHLGDDLPRKRSEAPS